MATSGQAYYFKGRLQGAQEVPPTSSTGMGSVYVLADKGTDSVFLTGNFTGLVAPAKAAHIHISGLPGVSGPVLDPLIFSANTSGTLHLADTISAEYITQMMNGQTYVNVHTGTYPNGEIRGQLTMLSQMHFLKAMLTGTQQVPPNASTGMGTVIVKYSSDTKILALVGDYQNVSADVTAAHIHAPALPGANASILFPLTTTGGTSGVLSSTDTLTPDEETQLLGGMMYVNVHNATYPDGEIRGQLTTIAGDGQYLTGNLQGAQQVPVNTSAAVGNVTVLLDKLTDSVYVTGSFAGLATAASAAHIHRGLAGESGPIVVPLHVTAATAGTVTGAGLVSVAFADSIIMGYSYVNVHNSTYPAGEIRGQLGNLVLPVKLLYFNGYNQGSNASLVWQSANEVNLRSFEIEQQDAATGTWVKKSSVPAVGGANGSTYKITDVPLATKNGTALYRLKMIDADGRYSYSPVISLVFNGSKVTLSIVPNPVVNGELLFTITGLANDAKASVKIIDFSGKTVSSASVSTLQNNHINIGSLPSGLYKAVVHFDGTTLQKTFSKQ